jgi:hypothetical protein
MALCRTTAKILWLDMILLLQRPSVRLHFLREEYQILGAQSFPMDVWSKPHNTTDYNEWEMEYIRPTFSCFIPFQSRKRIVIEDAFLRVVCNEKREGVCACAYVRAVVKASASMYTLWCRVVQWLMKVNWRWFGRKRQRPNWDITPEIPWRD